MTGKEYSLEGKRGIITGGIGGLGQSMCEEFDRVGARVAIFDIDQERTQEGAARLGARHIGIGVDITDASQVASAVQRVVAEFGGLDYLINNAGIRYEVSFLEQDVERWRHTLEVNLTGSFLCAQAAAREMIKSGGGKIVNIASIAGASAFRGRPAYVTSKAGVMGLTRAIAWELGPSGIYCNAIAPGIVETPLTAHYFTDPALAKLIHDNTPVERWAQPEEIAKPAVFLCSAASDFIQGTTLFVDGGWLSGKGY